VPSAAGASGSGASGSGPGASSARSAQSTPTQRRQARRKRARRYERRLRSAVTRFQSCLGSLPEGQRQVLELRGGTNGPPKSRRATARELGISTSETARREHRGVRALRRACGGGGGGGSSSGTASTMAARGAPALQPTAMLADAPPLRQTADLRNGEQGVAGETASGGEDSSSTRSQYASVVPGTSLQPVAGDASSMPLVWIPVFLLLALLMAGLIATRRRSRTPAVVGNGAYVTPAVVAPERESAPAAEEPEPDAEPELETAAVTEPEPSQEPAASQSDWNWPPPAAAPEHPENPLHGSETAHRVIERARRPAAAAAAGIVGVVVRELLRRRRK
jgi:hypothetical protein